MGDEHEQLEAAPPAHPEVIVLSHYEAGEMLRDDATAASDRPVRAVISIGGPYDKPCMGFESIEHRLRLVFDDVSADINNDAAPADSANIQGMVSHFLARMKRAKAEAMGLRVEPPTAEHASQIIDFARTLAAVETIADAAIVCHCQAGVSRSAGAAVLCLATWTGPGHEHYCVEQVLRVRSFAIPHADLIRFGDDLLQRQGKLIKALDECLNW